MTKSIDRSGVGNVFLLQPNSGFDLGDLSPQSPTIARENQT